MAPCPMTEGGKILGLQPRGEARGNPKIQPILGARQSLLRNLSTGSSSRDCGSGTCALGVRLTSRVATPRWKRQGSRGGGQAKAKEKAKKNFTQISGEACHLCDGHHAGRLQIFGVVPHGGFSFSDVMVASAASTTMPSWPIHPHGCKCLVAYLEYAGISPLPQQLAKAPCFSSSLAAACPLTDDRRPRLARRRLLGDASGLEYLRERLLISCSRQLHKRSVCKDFFRPWGSPLPRNHQEMTPCGVEQCFTDYNVHVTDGKWCHGCRMGKTGMASSHSVSQVAWLFVGAAHRALTGLWCWP